ncbi:MAG: hypothetical protein CMJ25_21415 [Phycisphaerae bacterium]|nr:hypothetical protein [Phycisphaerae bacterium]|tara:strand:+ start:44618 stop:45916 length:1299 start_codon:yes stop_codon:yes gene_type:complete
MPSKIVITSKLDPKVTLEYSSPKSSVSFADLKVSSFLDADSPHKWFYNTYAFSDAPEIGFSKTADADTFTFADASAVSFGKASADTFGFSESVLTQITFFRTFADAFALDDITAVDAVTKDVASAKTNLFGFSDDQAIGVGKGLSDTFGLAEAIDSFGIGKGLTDSQLITESLDRTVQYSREFTDAFVLDDAATVDALQKATSALKQNIFGMGDVFGRTVAFNREFTDSVTPTENYVSSFSKAATDDSFSVLESLSRVVAYARGFTESQGFADVVETTAVGKGISDTQAMTEAHTASMSLPKSDSFSVAEAASSLFGKPFTEAVPLSESLGRVVSYNRAFTDSFSMDDAATVDALAKDYANTKTNVFGFSDSQAFGFSKALPTDTFSFSDDEDLLFGKGLTDSVPMSEDFSFALFSNAAMNAAQLNLSPFNE